MVLMGGLAESNAGYGGFTPANPPTVNEANRCAHTKYECNSVVAQLKTAGEALEREKLANIERTTRLNELEDILQRGELGGKYSLNMERIKKMQDIDILQRNDIFNLEKTLSDLKRANEDLRNGATESRALAKLNKIEAMLRTIPHASMCKVEDGIPCVCHLKAIKGILDSTEPAKVDGGKSVGFFNA